MPNNLLGAIIAAIVGALMASVTLFGLVSSQTSGPQQNPVNAEQPAIDYGS